MLNDSVELGVFGFKVDRFVELKNNEKSYKKIRNPSFPRAAHVILQNYQAKLFDKYLSAQKLTWRLGEAPYPNEI